MTTRKSQISKLRELLHRRRRDLLATHSAADLELESLKNAERDPEYEENAQAELADYTLTHLMENQRHEVRLIDAALTRIEQGVFGECVDCGSDIPFERLVALPYAIRCEEDASRHEFEQRGAGHYATPSL